MVLWRLAIVYWQGLLYNNTTCVMSGRCGQLDIFLFILGENIAPLFLILLLGFLLAKVFPLHVPSFSKTLLYLFMPSVVFVKVYEMEFRPEYGLVIVFGFTMVACMFGLGWLVAKLGRKQRSMAAATQNALMFYNSGNFGLPLVTLVFQNTPWAAYAITLQIMIMMIQNITTNTIGVINARSASKVNLKEILSRTPALYTLTAALLLRLVPFDIRTTFVWTSFSYISNGMVPFALLIVGAQLAQTKVQLGNAWVYFVATLRLLGGPAVALLLTFMFRFPPEICRVLLISSSVPTAVNTALVAVECNNEPDFSTQEVVTCTLMSAFTLTGVIYLSRILWPI